MRYIIYIMIGCYSIFMTIAKKANAKEYGTMNLTSYIFKIFFHIVYIRLYAKIEEHICQSQGGV